jgi:hypothetical protein
MRSLLIVAMLAATAATARADSPHLFYAELLGKNGVYGLGYEYAVTPRVSFGASGSFVVLRGEELDTAAGYAHVAIAHRAFVELGPLVARHHVRSPVMDWAGTSATGLGVFAALGYQRDWRRFVVRGSVSAEAGKNGVEPTVGLAIGVRP